VVTPAIAIPVGFTFYQPAPELSAGYKEMKTLKKQGVPTKQRPPQPPPNPHYPTTQDLALRLLGHFKAHQPTFKGHCITADALYGTATFVDGASALFGGVQVSRSCVAIRKSACRRANSTLRTILPRILGRRRSLAFGAVQR
jgi:hypothetical protein